MDYCISSVDKMRNDFQKADYQGEHLFAKGFSPWTPFPKTLICLRRSDKLARGRISRTRAGEAYLEVLWGGAVFFDRQSLRDVLRCKMNNPKEKYCGRIT